MIKRLLPSTDLFRNISTLVIGTFLAQLVPVLLQSVLRRMYPAEDFGILEVFISITGILMVVSALRFEVAVVLPEKRSDAVNLVFAGMFSSLFFNLLLLMVIILFEQAILQMLNLENRHSFMLYYLPPAIFLFSTYQVFNYYLVRTKAYKDISINKISRRIAEGSGQVLAGLAGKLTMGLIWGNMAGHIVNIAAGWWQMTHNGFDIKLFSLRKQWEMAYKYREYPLFNLIPALLNAVCMHLPLLLVNSFYTPETTAHFGLARLVLILPASILTLSISQVLLQTISEKYREKQSFSGDLKKILLMLGIMGALMSILILLWAPKLFALYAGSEYYISGVYARIFVLGAAIKLVVSPVSSIFIPLKKIKLFSLWQAGYFVLISMLFFARSLDIFTFLGVYLVIDLVAYGTLLIMIIMLTLRYERSLKETNNKKHE
ncbi:MAG: lipopolysaccharide biosynthesis protein [Bacteroidota bacterium]